MSYQVLARKYRPQSFEQVIGQEHITRTLQNAAASKRIAHGYLFSGMRGVGKTTMARILAKALNCEQGPSASPCNTCGNCTEITEGRSMDVIEIDGASNTGVDDVRELRENVLYAPARTRYKIYIIDEVHMLSKPAFNALLKTLEEPPEHVIFVFATTEPQKVPITIKSRCQCFEFRRIPAKRIAEQLSALAQAEGFSLDPESARLIAEASEGSMRDAQSLLDQAVSFCGEEIRPEETRRVLGVIDQELLDSAVSVLRERDLQGAMNLVERLHAQGVDLGEFCRRLQGRLRDLLLIRLLQDPAGLTTLSAEEIESLREAAGALEEDRLIAFLEHLTKTEEEVRRSSHPKMLLELALIKMARIEPLLEFREILSRLESLERRLGSEPGTAPESDPRSPEGGVPEVPHSRTETPGPAVGAAPDWEGLVARAAKIYPPLGSLLENGFLKEIGEKKLVIGFKKKIHCDMARDKRAQIAEIAREVLQRDLAVEVTLENGGGAEGRTLAEKREEARRRKREARETESLQNHVVREALRIFKGKILEVREFGPEPEGR